MKTCCGLSCCNYKTWGGVNPGCCYEGFCDYQRPIDSRGVGLYSDSDCNCGQSSNGYCPVHGPKAL